MYKSETTWNVFWLMVGILMGSVAVSAYMQHEFVIQHTADMSFAAHEYKRGLQDGKRNTVKKIHNRMIYHNPNKK